MALAITNLCLGRSVRHFERGETLPMINPYQPPGHTPRYASFPKRLARSCRLAAREFHRGLRRENMSWFQALLNFTGLGLFLLISIGVLSAIAVGVTRSFLSR